MNGTYQRLSEAIDKLENLSVILTMPLPDPQHVKQLRTVLPELIKDLKTSYVEITGENPWQQGENGE